MFLNLSILKQYFRELNKIEELAKEEIETQKEEEEFKAMSELETFLKEASDENINLATGKEALEELEKLGKNPSQNKKDNKKEK